jgi:hypothetical protein
MLQGGSSLQEDMSEISNNENGNSAATDKTLRMSYRIGRGEQGVLTFEPYKSTLLPLWRFRTVAIAKKSSEDLWERFEDYDRREDFVGMDMTRKFIQMVSHKVLKLRLRNLEN